MTSLVINMHINLVFEDSIWATGKEGVDFQFLTVVCATSGFLPCKIYHADSGELADVDTTKTSDSVDLDSGFVQASLKDHVQGGQPLMDIQLVSKGTDSSSIETDPDQELIKVANPVKPKIKHSGRSSTQLCMLCRVGLQSKTALNFHLKQCNPDQRPYHCMKCMNSFVQTYKVILPMYMLKRKSSVSIVNIELSQRPRCCFMYAFTQLGTSMISVVGNTQPNKLYIDTLSCMKLTLSLIALQARKSLLPQVV